MRPSNPFTALRDQKPGHAGLCFGNGNMIGITFESRDDQN